MATPELDAGATIGGYVLTGRTLGRGGFGIVYEGRHATLDRLVAIKIQAGDGCAVASDPRLIEEAKLIAKLRHPNIVDLFDIGTLSDGRVYLIMELLDGITLQAHLAAVGSMAVAAALPILNGIARALDAIHAKGFAHRDVKPANVMLIRDHDGALHAKLLDFGIAKALDPALAQQSFTVPGTIVGTPPYMSPEQCLGEPLQPASDVYALGVVAFRMLTGELPFEGAAIDVYHAHVHEPAPTPSSKLAAIDPRLDAPLLAMLAKEPNARPQSATAAIAALVEPVELTAEATVKGVTGNRRSVAASRTDAVATRSRVGVAIAAGAVVVIAVVAVIVGANQRGASDERPTTPTLASSPSDAPRAVVAPAAIDAAIEPPETQPAVAITIDAGVSEPRPHAPPTGHHASTAAHAGSGSAKPPGKDALEDLPDAYRDKPAP